MKNEMPNNPDAEAAVLGSIFVDNDSLADVAGILSADDFYRQANRIIYGAMRKMAAENTPIDLMTVTDSLQKSGDLERAGGIAWITAAAIAAPSATNVEYYAKIVADASKRRKVIAIAMDGQQRAIAGEDEIDSLLDDMQHRITDTMLQGGQTEIESPQELIMSVSEWFDRRIAAGDETGVPSGFIDLDRLTHGWQAGDLDIIAARPSMGKTALALNAAANACKRGKSVAFFSLEMPKEQLIARIISAEKGIDTGRIMNPSCLSEEEHARRLECLSDIYEHWNIHIDDRSGITPAELNARARRIKAKFGLDIIMIDYLQLMDPGKSRQENRTQEISSITRALKRMAKELGVPVIALSQLSRGVEQRADKHPMLSDLRESGSIEQDADMVMFLYRDDYYNPQTEKKQTDLTIAKHRNGPLDTIGLFFAKQFTKFLDLTTMEEPKCKGANQFGAAIPQKQWLP